MLATDRHECNVGRGSGSPGLNRNDRDGNGGAELRPKETLLCCLSFLHIDSALVYMYMCTHRSILALTGRASLQFWL